MSKPAGRVALALLLISGTAGAQTYDPASGASPLTLLAVPEDGVAYYQTLERVRALNAAGRWAEMEPLLDRMVREYPRDPETWMMLGRARDRLSRGAEAVAAWERAGALIGWDLQYANGYRVAVGHLNAGDRTAALAALRRMVFDRHGIWRQNVLSVFPQLEPLKDDPEFREITGWVDTTGWTRNQGWLHDIEFAYAELKRLNPDYRHRVFPAEFERRFAELKRNIPTLSDEEIFFGLKRTLAVLHQGHLVIWPGDDTPNRYLPVRFYAFPEGIFIIDAAPAHRDLVGSRVVTIGSLPAEEALRRLSEGNSVDGDMEYLWNTADLNSTYNLKGMGAIRATDAVNLTVQRPGAAIRRVSLPTLAASMEGRQDKLLAPPGVTPPLFLSDLGQTLWERALPEHDAVYVQVNNLKADTDETLDQFAERLWTALQRAQPKNLILDLRHNNGGTTQLYPDLLRTLIAYSRMPNTQVYVMIGRRTYSAAGNFVTDLERLTKPIFVGEASSECCNLYGDPAVVTLPYSRIQGEFTAVKWQLSTPSDRRREMSPEVPVQLTAAAYFAGLDPALDATLRLIAERRAQSTTAR
ncbi:MAG TPA: S41 family peptidase [Longimicrobium sp.]|uniref:S41 family peptidase n=1 Tax=Longimicrobium sp. TaxID=2029185 RepID=UPI002ED9B234